MPMTNAEWPKRYRQRLKEKYLTGELKKKGNQKGARERGLQIWRR